MVLKKVPGMTAPETMTIRTTHTLNRRSNHLSHEIAQSFIIQTRIIDFRTKVNARSHPCTRCVPTVLARGFICHPYSVSGCSKQHISQIFLISQTNLIVRPVLIQASRSIMYTLPHELKLIITVDNYIFGKSLDKTKMLTCIPQ